MLVMFLCCVTLPYSYGEEQGQVGNPPEDGIYTVNVALWHQVMDKPSMGNKGIVPEAEIQVKDGRITMFLETQIIQVTGITASLVAFFYFDAEKQDFSKSEARAYSFEIDGQKRPRIFIFPIDYGQEFYRCMVDPRVEVMGDKPIEARIKVDWSSLKNIEKSLKQELIDETAESDIEAKVELKKQEEAVAVEPDGGAASVSKEKHQLMEVRPIEGALPKPDVSMAVSMNMNPQEVQPVEMGEVDFTKTVDYGTASKEEVAAAYSGGFDMPKPEERKGVIFGVLFLLTSMVVISISVIAIYIKRIERENRRAAELDIFEGDLQI